MRPRSKIAPRTFWFRLAIWLYACLRAADAQGRYCSRSNECGKCGASCFKGECRGGTYCTSGRYCSGYGSSAYCRYGTGSSSSSGSGGSSSEWPVWAQVLLPIGSLAAAFLILYYMELCNAMQTRTRHGRPQTPLSQEEFKKRCFLPCLCPMMVIILPLLPIILPLKKLFLYCRKARHGRDARGGQNASTLQPTQGPATAGTVHIADEDTSRENDLPSNMNQSQSGLVDVESCREAFEKENVLKHLSSVQVCDEQTVDNIMDLLRRDNNLEQQEKGRLQGIAEHSWSVSSSFARKVGLISKPTCSICLETYKINDTISWSKETTCTHIHHQDCIVSWLLRSEEKDCPLCRKRLIPVES